MLWDLRSAMPFLPAASDSGYYGTYRGPFVLAGRYTAKLTLGGKEQSQQFDVRADARANAAPAALAARQAMSARIAELSGTYAAAAKAFATRGRRGGAISRRASRRRLTRRRRR